jgi:hypothetical protein
MFGFAMAHSSPAIGSNFELDIEPASTVTVQRLSGVPEQGQYDPNEDVFTMTGEPASGDLVHLILEGFFIPPPEGAIGESFTFALAPPGSTSFGPLLDVPMTWERSTGQVFSDWDKDGLADPFRVQLELRNLGGPLGTSLYDLVLTTGAIPFTMCPAGNTYGPANGTALPPWPLPPGGGSIFLVAAACPEPGGLNSEPIVLLEINARVARVFPAPALPAWGVALLAGALAFSGITYAARSRGRP